MKRVLVVAPAKDEPLQFLQTNGLREILASALLHGFEGLGGFGQAEHAGKGRPQRRQHRLQIQQQRGRRTTHLGQAVHQGHGPEHAAALAVQLARPLTESDVLYWHGDMF